MPRPLFFALLNILLFVGLALPAAYHYLLPGEELLYQVIQAGHSPFFTSLFRTVTRAGKARVLVPVGVGVFLWQLRHWRLLLFLAFYALGVPLLEGGMKQAVDRPRPRHSLASGALFHSTHGFPSGHALAAAVFYGMLLVLLLKRVRHRGWRWGITGGLLLLILLIGVSRIYLGAHWPSDVLGGYTLGGAYCSLATMVCGWIERREEALRQRRETETEH